MSNEENITWLETAFYVAEVHLGVTRLIDPEDVDVENPDEKSIMTYVAQFLHRYPEGTEGKVELPTNRIRYQGYKERSWAFIWAHRVKCFKPR